MTGSGILGFRKGKRMHGGLAPNSERHKKKKKIIELHTEKRNKLIKLLSTIFFLPIKRSKQ